MHSYRIATVCGLLVAEFRRCGEREVLEVYQDLALLLCEPHRRHAVLLVTGSEDPEIHYALRDVICTLARVLGDPMQMDAAVVGSSLRLKRVCGVMRPALRPFGCELRLFDLASEALSWLLTAEPQVSERVGACGALP
jgi:hypothetical protein